MDLSGEDDAADECGVVQLQEAADARGQHHLRHAVACGQPAGCEWLQRAGTQVAQAGVAADKSGAGLTGGLEAGRRWSLSAQRTLHSPPHLAGWRQTARGCHAQSARGCAARRRPWCCPTRTAQSRHRACRCGKFEMSGTLCGGGNLHSSLHCYPSTSCGRKWRWRRRRRSATPPPGAGGPASRRIVHIVHSRGTVHTPGSSVWARRRPSYTPLLRDQQAAAPHITTHIFDQHGNRPRTCCAPPRRSPRAPGGSCEHQTSRATEARSRGSRGVSAALLQRQRASPSTAGMMWRSPRRSSAPILTKPSVGTCLGITHFACRVEGERCRIGLLPEHAASIGHTEGRVGTRRALWRSSFRRLASRCSVLGDNHNNISMGGAGGKWQLTAH